MNRLPIGSRVWTTAIWVFLCFMVVNILGLIGTVVVNSFGTHWFDSWLPAGFTTRWYHTAWSEFQLTALVTTTFEIVAAVVVLSILIGVPAAYAMARRDFAGKKIILLLFILPLLIPPITYGIPLATVLYRSGLGGTMNGVIVANLVPSIPFVILMMIPFVEQIDPRVEAAARVFGAGTARLLLHILTPMLAPGILAAILLTLVRTMSMFELSFLTSGPTSQTLVVALYYSVFAAGVRAGQSIDAMAVVYTVSTLVWLLLALRFINPAQIVGRART
jgi:putative spermidine/putrescine transport system permease protein